MFNILHVGRSVYRVRRAVEETRRKLQHYRNVISNLQFDQEYTDQAYPVYSPVCCTTVLRLLTSSRLFWCVERPHTFHTIHASQCDRKFE